jgi:hypothetical protein
MSQENIGTVSKDLSELRQELVAYEAATKKSSMYWKFGGAILLIFVFSYLTYAYVQVKNFLQPESIAATIDGLVIDKAPVMVKEGANSLIAMAPDVIETGKAKALEYIPLARIELEGTFESLVKDALAEYSAVVNTALTDALKDPANKAIILQVNKSPKAAADLIAKAGKRFTDELDKILRKETGESLNKKLSESQRMLAEIRDKLRRLQKGENLSAEERLERHFLQLVLADTVLAPDAGAPAAAPAKATPAKKGDKKAASPAKAPAAKGKAPAKDKK